MRSVFRNAALLAMVFAAGCYDLSKVDHPRITSNVADWRDEVIYQIIVDRFADGDVNNDWMVDPNCPPNSSGGQCALGRYQGGDWQGVIDHLDYLHDLGVTALWISPVVRNVDTDANFDGYHGYWAQDLAATNPHMGDMAKLREMVDAAHARGFKVILDIVTNHMGQLFFYDINKNGVPDDDVFGLGCPAQTLTNGGCAMPAITHLTEYDPDFDARGIQAYTSLGESGPAPVIFLHLPDIHREPPSPPFDNLDFYHKRGRIVNYDYQPDDRHQPGIQTLTGDFPGGLKDLATESDDVRQALIQAYSYWIDQADFDAFRIDTLKHVEHDFWKTFCPAVRQHAKAIGKHNFFMFGEAFDGDDQLVGSYTGGEQVDSAFFFPQKFAVIDRVIKFNQAGTKAIEDQFTALKMDYGAAPNSDGPTDADGKPLVAQQLMVNFLDNHDIPRFLYDKVSEAPLQPWAALHQALAYEFTEIGIPCVYYGTEQQFRGGNDPSNRERLWDTGFDETNPTFQWIAQLNSIRRSFRPLRHGDLEVKWSTEHTGDEGDAGIFAFERVDGDKRVLVVMNVSEKHPSSTQAADGAMKVGFAAHTGLVNVLPDGDAANQAFQVGGDGTLVVTVPPRGFKILVANGDQGGIP